MANITFRTALELDRAQKAEQRAKARATAIKAQEWESKGYRRASACIVVVEGDKAIIAERNARKARAKAIQDEQKRLFAEMVQAYNLKQENITE